MARRPRRGAPAPTAGPQPNWKAWVLPICVLIVAAGVYGTFGTYAALNGRTWTDEVSYLVKSWWYVNGTVAPYTTQDATWYMPLFFYQLGWAQKLAGAGYLTGRFMSLGFGAASGVLLFLTCRKLTAHNTVSAIAVLIYLATPTTAYYFATATPLATVAFLHMLAIWLLVTGLGRPRIWVSVALGAVFFALYFYRPNMILAIIVLAPLHLMSLGREHRPKALLALIAPMIVGTAALLLAFPERLAYYAIRLPLVTPIAIEMGVLPDNFRLIQQATESPYNLGNALSSLSLEGLVNAFLLPYAGTLILALTLFFVAGRPLRILLIVPAYFVFLAVTHFLGSAGYCSTCILPYTNYFIGVGALAAALTLALLWRTAKSENLPATALTLLLAFAAVEANAFAPGLVVARNESTADEFLFFPEPMLRQIRTLTEMEEADAFAKIVTDKTPAGKRVLVVHNLPSLAYSVFRAGRVFPPQSLNMSASYLRIAPTVPAANRPAVVKALEEESLWTDESLRRWVEKDYDVVVYQEEANNPRPSLEALLNSQFDLVTRAGYRGWNVSIYVRKPPA